MLDSDILNSKKLKVGSTIAYFIAPVDAIPEGVVGPAGYIDDVALSAYVVNDIVNDVDDEIVLRNWAGEENLLDTVSEILDVADDAIGSGVWKQMKEAVLDETENSNEE